MPDPAWSPHPFNRDGMLITAAEILQRYEDQFIIATTWEGKSLVDQYGQLLYRNIYSRSNQWNWLESPEIINTALGIR